MIPNLRNGPLAQPVEQLTFNQLVGRSNRPRPTIFSFVSTLLQVIPENLPYPRVINPRVS